MSTVTENDLQRLEDLINSKFDKVFEELTAIKVDIATISTEVKATNNRIDEMKENTNKRIDSVDNRLNTVTLGVFGIIGVLVTALITFVGKVVFFPNLIN